MIKKILRFIGVILATVAVSFASIAVFDKILELLQPGLTYDQSAACSGTLGIVVGSVFIALLSLKRGWCKDLKERRIKLDQRVVPVSLFAVAAVQVILGSVLALIFSKIHPLTPEVNSDSSLMDYVCSILLAPISEELMFRYGFYGALRHSFNKKISMVITTVAFALVHGFQLQAFIMCLAVGFILVCVFEKTGNIWYSISVHAALNAFVSLENYLVKKGIPFYTEVNGYVIKHVAVIIVAVVIALITGYLMLGKGRTERVQSTGC